jgi:outer membrane lipoprotein-sorting protein
MFKDESELKKVIDRLNVDTEPNQKHRDDLRGQMLRVFNEAKQQSQKPATPHGVLRRIIMKSHKLKLAAAAVIIIAILVGLPFFSSNGSSVALADVLERIEQTRAFMYKMEMTITGAIAPAKKQEMKGTTVISNEYGMKAQVEITTTDADLNRKEMTQQMYLLPDQKLMLTITPEQKKYMRMELDDDMLARQKKQNNDPREMMKQILACKYTELGRSEINGIEVEGFKTTDPMFSAGMADKVEVKLWVDVKTWLPVLWEMDMMMNEQMEIHGVISDFQWDIPVVASDFEPVIPADYTSMMDEGYKMPSMTEEAALEGLKFFAEIAGKYPNKVDLMSLVQEFQALKDRKDLTETGKRLGEEMGQLTMEERSKKIMGLMQPVQSLGMFYLTLMQDKKEPVYYGQSVGLDNIDAVLMRWKVSEGQYRVIFGDLSARDVSADELTRLEKLTPK